MSFIKSHKEGLVILGIWLFVFVSAPLYLMYEDLVMESEVDWQELEFIWAYELGFLVLFLIHHYWLVPQLVHRRHFKLYILSYVPTLLLFSGFLFAVDSVFQPFDPMGRKFKGKDGEPPALFNHRGKNGEKPFREDEKPFRKDGQDFRKDGQPFREDEKPFRDHGPRNADGEKQHRHFKPFRKHGPLPAPIAAKLVIAALMMGVDFGLVAWSRQQTMGQRLLLLERLNLERELEHLRQQINPHFLMNTLNNIHALVDIDSERTKRAIVQLSCLMRYALYHGSETLVPLTKDLEALDVYFQLVRLRYTNKVDIQFSQPEQVSSNIVVPPLIFATFIENAFKHGISYRHPSYVHASLTLTDDGRHLLFQCINSRHAQTNTQSPKTKKKDDGIGLQNVRKRLDILYEDRYTLTINDTNPNTYSIELTLPTTQP